MPEIILSFFAIIGLMFLIIYICDYFFYRNYRHTLTLIVDIRKLTVEECIETFELITSIRRTTIGKAAIGSLLVLTSTQKQDVTYLAKEYMRIFRIPGIIQEKDH